MGGSSSREAPPPNIVEDPYPGVKGADSISLSQAVKCDDCQLGVDTNISVSSVKLKRELGDIQASQCLTYATDKERVKKQYMSLSDFLTNLQAGKYARGTADEITPLPGNAGTRTQSYCQMISISAEDAAAIKNIDEVDGKLKGGSIRKVSGSGGYSSGTKARFVPSIPFKMTFAGTKVVMVEDPKTKQLSKKMVPFSDPFTVTQIALYYPSPIRVDSVQADAMLSLNDPSDGGAPSIILIPLRSNNGKSEAAEFISKIASRVPAVRSPDEATGAYLEVPIQTGADWALGKLFTLNKESGKGGIAAVQNGFFTWTGVPGYERVRVDTAGASWRGIPLEAGTIQYTWKLMDGLASPQYFLLDSPLDINSTDLAMLTSTLEPTPPSDAIHAIPVQADFVFHKAAVPPAPDTISGRTPCGITNLCEGFTVGTLNEQLAASDSFETSCPGAKCDPFLQNIKQLSGNTFGTTLFTILFNVLVFVAMAVGAYVALRLISLDYDVTIRDFSEKVGIVLAVWVKAAQSRMPSVSRPASLPGVGSLLNLVPGVGNVLKKLQ